jgi:acyl carrier protein
VKKLNSSEGEKMNDFLLEMAKILEADQVKGEDALRDFDLWDSLTVLAVLAFVDESYSVNISALEMAEIETIDDLHALIVSKK